MECPHCGTPLAFSSCLECGREIPTKSRFCCWCGNPVAVEETEKDVSERVPCSDGNCIGTINERGVCNLCGKSSAGEHG